MQFRSATLRADHDPERIESSNEAFAGPVNSVAGIPQTGTPPAEPVGTMTSDLFPSDGSRLELDNEGVRVPGVRVVKATGASVTVSLALDDVPPPGATVTLRWPVAPRGRCSVPATVSAIDENRVELRLAGEPVLEQHRHFVRGGGGESVLLVRPGEEEVIGWVHDISERSVRAHFSDVDLRPGNEMVLRVQLGPEVVEFPAVATKVSAIRQQLPARGPMMVEMVAVFENDDDRQAKVIRRYVLRQQVARAREIASTYE